MTTANILSQLGSAGVSTGFKNRIINGNMVIDQRNAGASVTATNGTVYTVDRWATVNSLSSKFSVQQNAGSVTPPAGFSNYLGATSLAATTVGSSDYYQIVQSIEGFNTADLNWGAANAKTVTLSFWVRSSLTGTFGGTILNSSENYSYPYSYTISAANTWEQKTVTVIGPTAGTWLGATNGIGMQVRFSLGMGSTYSGTANAWASGTFGAPTGATSVVGTSGATFYITGVQLEVGTTATNFDFRSYGTELALCQRYYQKIIDPSSTGVNAAGSQATRMTIYMPVTMRTLPSIAASGTFNFWNGTATATSSSLLAYFVGNTSMFQVDFTAALGATSQAVVMYTNGGSQFISASAEL